MYMIIMVVRGPQVDATHTNSSFNGILKRILLMQGAKYPYKCVVSVLVLNMTVDSTYSTTLIIWALTLPV